MSNWEAGLSWLDSQAEKEAKGNGQDKDYHISWCSEVEPVLDQPMLVQDVLTPGSMSVVYGESNSGKTFFTMDMDMHIASNTEWNGRYVTPGIVLYFAAEGAHSVTNRVAAYKQYVLEDPRVPFGLITTPINLLHPYEDTLPIIRKIKEVEDRYSKPVVKVSIDTLARVMPGNENSSEDMGALVRNGDEIRNQTETHLQWVHHCGKDTAKGARGHSSLRAATDTELEVSNNSGVRVVTATKQRDLAANEVMVFKLRQVKLGTDPKGYEVTTCVVEPCEASGGRQKKLTKREQIGMSLLNELLGHEQYRQVAPKELTENGNTRVGQWVLSGAIFRDRLASKIQVNSDKPDTKRRTVGRIIEGLQSAEKIDINEDWIWLKN